MSNRNTLSEFKVCLFLFCFTFSHGVLVGEGQVVSYISTLLFILPTETEREKKLVYNITCLSSVVLFLYSTSKNVVLLLYMPTTLYTIHSQIPKYYFKF